MTSFTSHIAISRSHTSHIALCKDGRPGIPVEDDAQVRAGDFANTNYGTIATLRVKTDLPVDFTYWSYIKINISAISQPVISAKIRAIVQDVETGDKASFPTTISAHPGSLWLI